LNEVWIEGIGSVHGPFFPNSPVKFSSEVPDSLMLTCSFADNQDFFVHPSYSDCYVDITLGIENQEMISFIIYPNPVSSILTIESSQKLNGDIEIYDVNGKLVKSLRTEGIEMTIDVYELENGMYFIYFETGKKRVVKRIVIER
jgi:hypothetical protein